MMVVRVQGALALAMADADGLKSDSNGAAVLMLSSVLPMDDRALTESFHNPDLNLGGKDNNRIRDGKHKA
jgi:hypothetical protein